MTHKGTVTLETERLILRQFTVDDAGAMFRNWASDPEVTKFLTWPLHGTIDGGVRKVGESDASKFGLIDFIEFLLLRTEGSFSRSTNILNFEGLGQRKVALSYGLKIAPVKFNRSKTGLVY